MDFNDIFVKTLYGMFWLSFFMGMVCVALPETSNEKWNNFKSKSAHCFGSYGFSIGVSSVGIAFSMQLADEVHFLILALAICVFFASIMQFVESLTGKMEIFPTKTLHFHYSLLATFYVSTYLTHGAV